MRRRIYLMRHADVSYFDKSGGFLIREDVPLTPRLKAHDERIGYGLGECGLADTKSKTVMALAT